MQVIVLALLKKAAPFLALAVVGLAGGFYFGYHIGSDGLVAAKLALSVQQADDAKAVAAANAASVAEMMTLNAKANVAEVTVAAAAKQANLEDTKLAGEIAAQAVQPGQDAPDAPVLAHTLDALKGLQ